MAEERKRKFRLRRPEVTRVDIVDRGANQDSHILLAKRDEMPLPQSHKDPRLLNRPVSPGIGQTPPTARPGLPQASPRPGPGAPLAAPGAPAPGPRPLAGMAGSLQAQQSGPPTGRPAPSMTDMAAAEGADPDPDEMDGEEDELLTQLLRQRMKRRQFSKPPKKKAPAQPGQPMYKGLEDVLETVTKGLSAAGVFTQDATGRDLRDMLPKEAITSLANIVSTSKSAETPEDDMTEQELQALVDDLPDEVIDFIGELEDRATAAETEVAKLRTEVEPEEVDPITKALSALPPDVAEIVKAQQDRLTEAETALANERIAKADAVYVTKAREFDGLIDKAEDFGPVLRSFSETHPEAAQALESTLRAASQRLAKSAMFSEYGHDTPGTGSAESQVMALAKSLREAKPDLSDAEARAEIWDANPDLYAQHTAERQAK